MPPRLLPPPLLLIRLSFDAFRHTNNLIPCLLCILEENWLIISSAGSLVSVVIPCVRQFFDEKVRFAHFSYTLGNQNFAEYACLATCNQNTTNELISVETRSVLERTRSVYMPV